MSRPDSLTVLVVDDEIIVRDILEEFLAFLGHSTREAEDGLAGLQSLQDKRYDAVFADIRMPGLDGMGFLRKCLEKQPDMPVIMISGHGNDELRKKAIGAGAFGFLDKPFSFDDIQGVVGKINAVKTGEPHAGSRTR